MAKNKYFLIWDEDKKLIGKMSYAGVSGETEKRLKEKLAGIGTEVEEVTQARYDLMRVYED